MIVITVKVIIDLLLIHLLVHLNYLKLFFLTFRHLLFYCMMILNTMLSLSNILQSTYGFTLLEENLMCMTSLFASKLL